MGFSRPEVWEQQFFEGIDTEITIPVDDVTAYQMYPQLRWVYNKLNLTETQHIHAYPQGVPPSSFPVFSKPIINLYGMGCGAKTIYEKPKESDYEPGHFWMEVLEGKHHSTDFAIIDGRVKWMCAMEAHKNVNGSFTHFSISSLPPATLNYITSWIYKHIPHHTGIVNFETIGDTIIECHLRMSCQFIDLYGDGWLQSVVDLYQNKHWDFDNTPKEGYSYILRTTFPGVYTIGLKMIEHVLERVNSVQLTYKYNVAQETNDEYSYRLAVVNGFDSNNCIAALEDLRNGLVPVA